MKVSAGVVPVDAVQPLLSLRKSAHMREFAQVSLRKEALTRSLSLSRYMKQVNAALAAGDERSVSRIERELDETEGGSIILRGQVAVRFLPHVLVQGQRSCCFWQFDN